MRGRFEPTLSERRARPRRLPVLLLAAAAIAGCPGSAGPPHGLADADPLAPDGPPGSADAPPARDDAAPSCGDDVCAADESCSACPADCGPCEPARCGDGACDVTAGEDCGCCPQDCGACSYGASDRFVDGTAGDDDDPGTFAAPYRTIQRGVDALAPGETLHVRAGTYRERVRVDVSGTTSQRVQLRGYECERPVIDGEDTSPGAWAPLLLVTGSHVVVSDLEIARSTGRGVQVWASGGTIDVTLRDLWVHHTVNAGIFAEFFTDLTIEASRIWQVERVNDPDGPWYQDDMWGAGIQPRRGTNLVIRRCEVFNSYGEGINVHSNVDGVVIEDNVLYDSFGPQLYPINDRNVLIRRNLVYHTNDPEFRRGGEPGAGIVLADENHGWDEWLLSDYTVVNNIVVGTSQPFAFWTGWHAESGLVRTLVAHNTFIHTGCNDGCWGGVITIEDGDHATARFENNLVVRLEGDHAMASVPGAAPALAANLWWPAAPPAAASSATDVRADPLLTLTGTVEPGLLTPEHARLTAGSPAIGAAAPSEVDRDFFDAPRDPPPDIGAHELQGP